MTELDSSISPMIASMATKMTTKTATTATITTTTSKDFNEYDSGCGTKVWQDQEIVDCDQLYHNDPRDPVEDHEVHYELFNYGALRQEDDDNEEEEEDEKDEQQQEHAGEDDDDGYEKDKEVDYDGDDEDNGFIPEYEYDKQEGKRSHLTSHDHEKDTFL
ncbi:uncharacterized protein LOC141856067 [Brevipalpus obovatus]|uniref:uncharacterized protein LOC141856067 n=1 Tax=Brevipalpus obovatus TaxID=246614 RepID=UPI003D9F9FD0